MKRITVFFLVFAFATSVVAPASLMAAKIGGTGKSAESTEPTGAREYRNIPREVRHQANMELMEVKKKLKKMGQTVLELDDQLDAEFKRWPFRESRATALINQINALTSSIYRTKMTFSANFYKKYGVRIY